MEISFVCKLWCFSPLSWQRWYKEVATFCWVFLKPWTWFISSEIFIFSGDRVVSKTLLCVKCVLAWALAWVAMTGVLKLHVHVCLRSFVHLCYCPTSAFWFPFVLKNYLLYVIFWVCKYIMYFCTILWAYLHEWHYREVTKYRGTQMQSYNVFVWTLLSGSHIWWARFQACAHIWVTTENATPPSLAVSFAT